MSIDNNFIIIMVVTEKEMYGNEGNVPELCENMRESEFVRNTSS